MRAKPPVAKRYRASVVVCHQECLLGVKLRDPGSGLVRIFLPGGGIEPREKPAAAARRECLEETGFHVRTDPATAASHKTLRYPFLWAGNVYDCTTEFFTGQLIDPDALPSAIADDSELNLGPVWVPFTSVRETFGYHQGILDVILSLIDPCVKAPERSVLCAFSAFKGTLTAAGACEAAADGARDAGWTPTILPLADGGRGSMDLWSSVLRGSGAPCRVLDLQTVDPLGRPAVARVGLRDRDDVSVRDGTPEIFIESADCLGLHLVGQPNPATAIAASSRGLGILLRDLSRRMPAGTVVRIALGDSAVSDCGLGMLQALGFRILIRSDNAIEAIDEFSFNAALLADLAGIEAPEPGSAADRDLRALRDFQWTVLCDVNHPLCGRQGAARVFAPQKGALPVQVGVLEAGFKHVARLLDALDSARDPRRKVLWGEEPCGGASGGVAAALGAVFGGTLTSGARWLMEHAGFDDLLAKNRLVLTGEGTSDAQSVAGKAAYECMARAMGAGVKASLISGQVHIDSWPAWILEFAEGTTSCGREPDAASALRAAVTQCLEGETGGFRRQSRKKRGRRASGRGSSSARS